MRKTVIAATSIAAALVLTACGPEGAEPAEPATGTSAMDGGAGGTSEMDGGPSAMDGGDGGTSMMNGGEQGLGGTARTVLLGEATVDELPDGPLAWSGFPVSDAAHEHSAGFVHAREATTVTIDGRQQELEQGDAVFLPDGARHEHGAGLAWDVLLADPQVAPPPGVTEPAVFRSEPLEGLPDGSAQLQTLLVELQPGGSTSVHTHPGPEYIYVTRGPFVYENAVIGAVEAAEGDDHTLPAGPAVQKRKEDRDSTAAFLSWFVVDPDAPFAPPASFQQ